MTRGTGGGRARRAVVLGVGNPLYGDDGFGVEAAAAFARRYRTGPEVEVVDGGTEGLGLLGYIEEATELVLLDAVVAPGPPGTIVEVDGADLARGMPMRLSEHQVGVEEVLSLAAWRGRLPARAVLLGVVPERLDLGPGLSPPVAAALWPVLQRAARQLQAWGIAVDKVPEEEGG